MRKISLHLASAAVLSVMSLLLAGCQATMIAGNSATSPVAGESLHGSAHGGNQPISGSKIYLYAASSSGYGAAATSLLCGTGTTITCSTVGSNVLTDSTGNGYVLTDSNGGFNISSDYSCPANAQIYLLALGGNPGLGVNNPDIALMAALGSCSTLLANAATTFTAMNEVTTVAAAYALAPFMTSATNIGTSNTNAAGLANAFGTVYNLVNPATGLTPGVGQPVAGSAPTGEPANLIVPTSEINTLANILSYCINSDPATTPNCGNLFTASTANSVTPTNTVEAALNIAKNPGTVAVSTLYGYETPQAAFSPVLGSAPNDWTIGILYSGGSVTPVNSNNGYGIAIDASGNVFATNNAAAYLTEVSALGVTTAIGNSITTPAIALNGSWGIAVDTTGNLWVSNSTSGKEALTKFDNSGNFLLQSTPTSGGGSSYGGMTVGSNPASIAIDGNDNVWFTNFTTTLQASISKFNSSGVAISPAGGYVQNLTTKSDKPLGITIDSSNNAWVSISKGAHANAVYVFSAANGTAVGSSPYLTASSPVSNTYGIAVDGNGNTWIPSRNTNALVEISSSTGTLNSSAPAGGYTGGGMASGALNAIAVDGDNNVWAANDVNANIGELVTTGTNAGKFASPVGIPVIAPTGGYQPKTTTGTRGIAIDPSGNIWASSNNRLLEIVGAAAPTVTPLALAVKNGTIGTRP